MERIDVHHHFIPQAYVEAYTTGGGDPSGWKLPEWSVQATESLMTEQNIGTTIFSLTSPGTSVSKGDAAAKLARQVNEYAASIRDSNPRKFGFFATLPPLLDGIDAALDEIAHSLDRLKADGVTLFTRYGHDNHYLGHPDFKRIWDELEVRKAVVFIHPTYLADVNLINPALPQPMIDYPHETCRTAVDLITSNTIRDHPNVKIILSHAGGTLPYIATRAAVMLPDFGLIDKPAEEFMEEARSFYFDLALSSNEFTLGLLLKFAKPGHVLFGSDFPYAPINTIRTHTKNLDSYQADLSEKEVFDIARGSALELFPRLGLDPN